MANNTKKVKVNIKKNNQDSFSKVTQKFKRKGKKNTEIVSSEKEKKRKKSKAGHIVLIGILIIMIAGALSCLSFCVYIIFKAPEFEVEKLYSSSSTTVYDINGEVIAELGAEKRDTITYDALPEIMVDAIVATEDSKFFQHSGIDLLRFSKAVLGQLLGHGDAGGGSTLTMQLAKNSYSKNNNGQIASHGIAGIVRKFTDIYMAVFKIEKTYSKQEILEFYVNQANFGNGAYGIQQAAQTYFGKDVGELNLSEAATLAGLFQAPSAYNPYQFPEKAQNRRDQVLNLMVRHGYITAEEAAVAKELNVEDMLSGYNYSYSEYQGFIDTLVADVYSKTKQDPALVSMNIYTTLDVERQKAINQVYDGTLYKWKDNVVQAAIAVTDVHTGAIVAIGTGRNRTGERQLNYATAIKRHAGSTIKPILDYGPAIEYEGWGSGTFIIDDVYSYTNGQSFNNFDGRYAGIMNAKTALAQSRNIPALQAFQATSQNDKYEFASNLGVYVPLDENKVMYESTSIGAYDGMDPVQLSAAYATFSRGGYYIEPYTFTKIEYKDTGATYVHTPTRSKAMSEETAYIINMMLKYAVTSGNVPIGSGVSGTDIGSKTGTSSTDNSLIQQLGISYSAIRDSWQAVYSPDYSIALWYGYDKITKEHYMTENEGWNARRLITAALTPRIMKKNSRWSQPSGVTTVDIETGTNMLASEFTPSNLRSTEYYKKGTEPTEVSPRFTRLDNVSNLSYTTVGNQVYLTWEPISTPWAIDEAALSSFFNDNYGKWADKYYQNRLTYNAQNIGSVVYDVYLKNPDGSLAKLGMTSAPSFSTTLTDSTNATFVVKSSYTIFKDNASIGSEITVKVTPTFPSTPDDEGDGDNKDKDEDNNTDNDDGNDTDKENSTN